MAPTQPNTGLQDWLNHLSALFPVECVVHVGAGSGFAVSRYAQWNVPRVMLLEADAGLARKLPDSIGSHAGWTARNVLVGATEGEQAFYVATNPNESGVIEPESLSFLWRNLRARERRLLPVTTVDAVLADADWRPDSINWLVADCLPALPVLQGAEGSLASCDVVLARVLLGGSATVPGAGVAEVDSYLHSMGFKSVARVEERLPAIATAVYVRNWKSAKPCALPIVDEGAQARTAAIEHAWQEAEAKLASMALKLAEANERLATSEARAEALAQLNRNQEKSLAAHEAAVAELDAMRSARTAETAELNTILAGKDATIAELNGLLAAKQAEFVSMQAEVERQTREHDDEALLQALQLAETKASLTQASQINARLENRLSEHQASIEDLVRSAREQTELAGQRQEQIEQLNRACEELVQQATERQARLEELARAAESAATEKSVLSSQVESLQAQLSALQADKEESTRSATANAAELVRAVEAAATEKSSLSAQVESLQAQLSALQADKEASSRLATTIAAELEQAREALKRSDLASDEASRRIDALQAQLASEQARAQQFLEHKLALDAVLAEQSRLLAAQEAKSTALADEHSQRLAQIDALQEERAAIAASATSMQAEVTRWQQAYEAERASATELTARLQQTSAANDEHARLAAERSAQIDQLKEESRQALARIATQQAELAGAQELSDHLQRITRDHDEHARVSRERLAHIEKLLAEAEQRTARISQLEAERGELDYRQRLLDAELVKAEAQIDLIKDVVLREKAF